MDTNLTQNTSDTTAVFEVTNSTGINNDNNDEDGHSTAHIYQVSDVIRFALTRFFLKNHIYFTYCFAINYFCHQFQQGGTLGFVKLNPNNKQ